MGDIVPLWRYDGLAGSEARAVYDIRRGDTQEVMQRMLRRLPGVRGAWASIKREMLRLELPGDPLLHQIGGHLLGLVRVRENTSSDGQPIVLNLGDRRTFLAFGDVEKAREWGRRVESDLGRRPPWLAFYCERWPWHADRFRPRVAVTGRLHGFTEMEAVFDEILARERMF